MRGRGLDLPWERGHGPWRIRARLLWKGLSTGPPLGPLPFAAGRSDRVSDPIPSEIRSRPPAAKAVRALGVPVTGPQWHASAERSQEEAR